ESHEAARNVFSQIAESTGVDVQNLCFEADEETLRQTQNAQLALYTCGLAAYACLDLVPDAFAGHSIGEYAAVVSAGVLSIGDGAKLVLRRGELMASAGQARPGTMAAILGLEREALQAVCESVTSGVCVIANDNCPGQLVISGDVAGVQEACAAAMEAGAKRALPLNVSGAFHSPLMEDSAREMGLALRAAPFGDVAQQIDVYANVTASKIQHASEWPDLLEKQLMSPVRWTESVQSMITDGIDSFVECGSGEVLCGLIKRINRDVATSSVFDNATLDKFRGVTA
ncbi:MAG TPA: ACP S-malonyltransferase, partial [Fimbriimonadaceae bacterium]|nr:ACP S-malonyltransferase [Fimbriimonadaceae bacterium]